MNTHQQQALNTLLSFTKLSRAIACVLVATYVTQLVAPASRQYTALVAGRFITLCMVSLYSRDLGNTSAEGEDLLNPLSSVSMHA